MGWIKSGERTLTAEDFNDRARRAATVIEGFGVAKGDGVALYLRNDLAFFEASFGVGMLGGYPVPVNWHYTPDEAGYLLRDSGVKLLVIHADLYGPIREAIPDGLAVAIVETPPEIRAAYGLAETRPPPCRSGASSSTPPRRWRASRNRRPARSSTPLARPAGPRASSARPSRPNRPRRPTPCWAGPTAIPRPWRAGAIRPPSSPR